MDFHAAMETFAEAWVAANTQTVVNPEGQVCFYCSRTQVFYAQSTKFQTAKKRIMQTQNKKIINGELDNSDLSENQAFQLDVP